MLYYGDDTILFHIQQPVNQLNKYFHQTTSYLSNISVTRNLNSE